MNNVELISIGENSKELFLKKDRNDIAKLLENVKKLKDETKNILKLDPDYTNVKNVIDEIDSLGVNFKYMLDSYSEFYKSQHDGFVPDSLRLPYSLSKKVLGSQIYCKKENFNFKTNDLVKDTYGMDFGSRFTYVFDIVINLVNDETIAEEDIPEVYESFKCMLFEAANTLHPRAFAECIDNMIPSIKGAFGERCEGDIIQIFETLVITEGNNLNNDNYIDIINTREKSNFVFDILSKHVFTDVHEILDDPNHHNWFNTILANSNYEKYRKSFYTNALLDLVIDYGEKIDKDDVKQNNMIYANRYIRQSVTDWIKTPIVANRKKEPEVYAYINIAEYLEAIYKYGVFFIGNIDIRINEFDKIQEDLTNSIKKIDEKLLHDNTEEENKVLKKDKENRVESLERSELQRKHLLRLESLISFLFIEIMSNEKLTYMSFDDSLIYSVFLHEPDVDNAMHSTFVAISSLYFKRDFKGGISVSPINPYFVHKGFDSDIASDEAKFIAKMLSVNVSYNNSSMINGAACVTPREISNVIISLKESLNKLYFHVKGHTVNSINFILGNLQQSMDNLDTYENKITDIIGKTKHRDISEAFNSANILLHEVYHEIFNTDADDRNVIKSFIEGIDKLNNKFKSIKDLINSYVESISDQKNKNLLFSLLGISSPYNPTGDIDKYFNDSYFNYLNKINVYLEYLKEAYMGTDNSFKVINEIMDNFEKYVMGYFDDENLKTLWPVLTQVNVPITENNGKPVLMDDIKFKDIKPGDIKSEKYRRTNSRFSTSSACD